ncbi:tripartite tricarboxylate transporter permease [uncultured Cohaesibacter sp.]|uniref:tripartite tricarboxylate transporter permease n=1 Tax=uncultured Cohaesibacter sp. TaxID=1002546 RepID=UPI00292EEE6A|nr:tripartite tricarboxylate transporter permease [uncultured Cohaesibacter sp.]
METLSLLLTGIYTAATTPTLLTAVTMGAVLGLLVGALPGLGPAAGVAIMLPVAVGFEPTITLALLAGVYYGAMFGGAVTAILIGIPGDAPAVMTVLDGHPLALKGDAGRALGVAIYSSFFGGLAGLIGLTLLAQIIARYALMFGPAEMTALMALSLSLVSTLGTKDRAKSFTALALGLWLGTIGLDQIRGGPRFTFGQMELFSGLDFAVVAVGMFGLGQMLQTVGSAPTTRTQSASYSYRSMMPRLSDLWICRKVMFMGSIMGFIIGVLPGVGATAATMMSYATAKKISKNSDQFGHGAIEGVAAPETANNSASYGAMVTLFTLGIPASATTAVLFAGLLMAGLQPGPRLFQEHSEFVWALFGTFYVGNFVLVFITLFLTPVLAAAIFVSRGLLFSAVIGIVVYGMFSIDYSLWAVVIMLLAGILGYIMNLLKYPSVPLILGLVLGPLFELGIRRTLIASRGDFTVFLDHAIAMVVFGITAMVVLVPILIRKCRLPRNEKAVATES